MTRVMCVMLASSFAAIAAAQPIPAGQRIGLAMFLQGGYAGLKADLTLAAEKMPEADYGFKPGSMPEVRTYGQLFAHVAAGQFSSCSAVKGSANPNQGKNIDQEPKTKAEFMKLLADSFAMCDEVFSSLTEANLMEFVKQGRGEIVKSAVLAGLLAHGAEMYGVATVYLRAKNLVPPSTERQQQRSGRGRGR